MSFADVGWVIIGIILNLDQIKVTFRRWQYLSVRGSSVGLPTYVIQNLVKHSSTEEVTHSHACGSHAFRLCFVA